MEIARLLGHCRRGRLEEVKAILQHYSPSLPVLKKCCVEATKSGHAELYWLFASEIHPNTFMFTHKRQSYIAARYGTSSKFNSFKEGFYASEQVILGAARRGDLALLKSLKPLSEQKSGVTIKAVTEAGRRGHLD